VCNTPIVAKQTAAAFIEIPRVAILGIVVVGLIPGGARVRGRGSKRRITTPEQGPVYERRMVRTGDIVDDSITRLMGIQYRSTI